MKLTIRLYKRWWMKNVNPTYLLCFYCILYFGKWYKIISNYGNLILVRVIHYACYREKNGVFWKIFIQFRFYFCSCWHTTGLILDNCQFMFKCISSLCVCVCVCYWRRKTRDIKFVLVTWQWPLDNDTTLSYYFRCRRKQQNMIEWSNGTPCGQNDLREYTGEYMYTFTRCTVLSRYDNTRWWILEASMLSTYAASTIISRLFRTCIECGTDIRTIYIELNEIRKKKEREIHLFLLLTIVELHTTRYVAVNFVFIFTRIHNRSN